MAPISLVHVGPEWRKLGTGLGVAEEGGPGGIGEWKAYIHDDDLTAPVALQEVTAANTAERHAEVGPHGAVRFAR